MTNDSLIGADESPQEETTSVSRETSETKETSDAKWYYDEGMPGSGDPPEYLQGKYKSVVEAAKAGLALRKHVGGFAGAPEKYEIKLEKDIQNGLEIDEEDDFLKAFTEFARNNNMTQSAYNEFVNLMAYKLVNIEEEEKKASEEFMAQEKEKLGPNGMDIIKQMKQWGDNVIPEEYRDVFREIGKTANGVQFLNYMKDKMGYTNLPMTPSSQLSRNEQHQKLKKMLGDDKYGRNLEYTQHVENLYKEYMEN